MFNIILGIFLCLIFMNYNQEIVQFLIHSGSIDSVISYLESLKYQRWVIFVENVNTHLKMDIIKNGCLFVTTVLKKSDLWMLDSLVRLRILNEW